MTDRSPLTDEELDRIDKLFAVRYPLVRHLIADLRASRARSAVLGAANAEFHDALTRLASAAQWVTEQVETMSAGGDHDLDLALVQLRSILDELAPDLRCAPTVTPSPVESALHDEVGRGAQPGPTSSASSS